MRVVVTGGLGFIGSNLVNSLLEQNHEIVVFDNLSTGDKRFLSKATLENVSLKIVDIANIPIEDLCKLMKGSEKVFHLAANADVRGGWNSTFRDVEENVIATHNIALAAREVGISEVIFSSTGCVYGDPKTIPTPEDEKFPIQTSLYGASKVGAEGILSAFAANGAFKVTTFRFVSVLGENYHHGHVIDFVRKLSRNNSRLEILGNGLQKKSYIEVGDCVRGLLTLRGKSSYEVFNIGHDYFIEVSKSAELIAEQLKLTPEFLFQDTDRGWIGDNPFTFLDISKAKQNGWSPTFSIEESIKRTVDWIKSNDWVLDKEETRK